MNKIIDVTKQKKYAKYMYTCLVKLPTRKYRKRYVYLEDAIRRGFHKKILIHNNDVVGQIEYAPARASGLPITGKHVFVMNCIWILRRAQGEHLGNLLLRDVVRSIKRKHAGGLATLALENHPSPWLKKAQLERLGFIALDSLELKCKLKHKGHVFKTYLMWLPIKRRTKKPMWKREKLLEGVTFCLAHPLYHAQHIKSKNIFETTER